MTNTPNLRFTALFKQLRSWAHRRPVWLTVTVLVYLSIFFLSYALSYIVRSDFQFSQTDWTCFYQTLGLVFAVKIVVFSLQRHFRNRWFYASVKDLQMITTSSIICLFLFSFINLFSDKLPITAYLRIPRGILIIDFGITIMSLTGLRFLWRYLRENIFSPVDVHNLKRALFIGANENGATIARTINARKDSGYYIVGFLTRHQYKLKMQISYIPILGMIDELPQLAAKHKVRDVLVVAGMLNGANFRALYETCQKNHITLQVIPANEIQTSRKIPIREIDINDLLRREPIRLNTDRINREISGKRVLVTGAGGSIGSEICRQVLKFNPSELILLGRGENRIFFLDRELTALNTGTRISRVIADVSNKKRVDYVFARYKPQIVFHAAAHKHVPLMEENVCEAVLNNIYGTKTVAECANVYQAERFVMISTDKAVNPSSIMGTSKHLAERFVNAIAETSQTKFIVTRFGNVLGSAGSVVPIFKQQIENGGPITITDKRMTRYFMTIPEASQLVLEAAALGNGGEIFVLDMGEPVRIEDLAKDMIRLAGLPENAIEIRETGLRPGEKLYEELYFESEKRIKTASPKLFAATHRAFPVKEVGDQIDTLINLLKLGTDEDLRKKLHELVPEFQTPSDKKPAEKTIFPS